MADLKQVYNFQCEVFEPKTANLSEKELKVKLAQLYGYFPFTNKGDGNKEPYEVDSNYSKIWFKCYDHLLNLITMRKQELKYRISFWTSIVALVISVVSIGVRLAVTGQI